MGKRKYKQKGDPGFVMRGTLHTGRIARLAANIVAKEQPYARTCYAEVALVSHSSMTQWVKSADKIVMIDGCFLSCIGRVINNLVDEKKIMHIDALQLHKKYSDVFLMEDVPEVERKETARQVADKILALLKEERVGAKSDGCQG